MAKYETTDWHHVSDELPPEGLVVETVGEHGAGQMLMRKGRLWFIPDGSMYVYYTPKLWRRVDLGDEEV